MAQCNNAPSQGSASREDQVLSTPAPSSSTNTASISKATKAFTQRIRPGILSRQASEREDGDTASGYLQSASEDDDARYSDNNSLPRRFAEGTSSAGSSIKKSKGSHPPSPLSPPPDSTTNTSLFPQPNSAGGGEDGSSLNSSRVNQPLQSRTSLYRRQASHDSYNNRGGGDFSEDGGSSAMYHGGSNSLSRAKSISSVSSVNSTSSMEAVPFRAPPLGNVRPGYGGYPKDRGVPSNPIQMQMYPWRGESSNAAVLGPTAESGSLSHLKPTDSTSMAKQKILPKGPSNEWLYRNAPGMGSKGSIRNGMTTYKAIGTPFRLDDRPSSISNLSERSAVISLNMDEEEEILDSYRQATSTARLKPSIRSKLAKRAGKLGLKPLTSATAHLANDSTNSTLALQSNDHSGRVELPSILLDRPGMPATLKSSTASLRSAKIYHSNTIATTLTAVSPEGETMSRTTSSVTHAPLVVPKNPPGPPGSGPAPSPGLIGPPSPFYPFSIASPKVSPKRLSDEVDPLFSPSAPLRKDRKDEGGIRGSYAEGREDERVDASKSLRYSLPLSNSTASSAMSSGAITPAQQIRKDAQAGIARAPAEPSGSTPGPNPIVFANQSEEEELNGFLETIQTRPQSMSVSTQTTARPNAFQNDSSSGWFPNIPVDAKGSTGTKFGNSPLNNQRRPSVPRASTGETTGGHRVNLSEQSKGLAVNEESGVSDYWSGRPIRSSSTSPEGNHAKSLPPIAAAGDSSTLTLHIPEEGLALPNDLSKRLSTLSPRTVVAGSDLTPHALKRSSPEGFTKPLPSIVESGRSDKDKNNVSLANSCGPYDGSANENASLPSTVVSSASASLRPVEIKHPEAATPHPGGYIPHPEELSTFIPASSLLTPLVDSNSHHQVLSISPPARSAASSPPLGHDSSQLQDVQSKSTSVSRSTRVETDFIFGDILGEGSYSTVMEAWDVRSMRERGKDLPEELRGANVEGSAMDAMVGKTLSSKQRASVQGFKAYAIKILDKVHILKEKKQKYVAVEREALSLLIRHPGVITLFWTFQNRDSLYFVLELAPNGELLTFIKRLGSFSIECARYYGAQLVETIQGMHDVGVLHRDLKPENILLDAEMKIKVTDFGSAKIFKKESRYERVESEGLDEEVIRTRPSSFVGTAEYVSPELLTDKEVSEASDWWSFGCLLYQMLCGRPPFKGISEYQTFQKIMKGDFEYPNGLTMESRDLLDNILTLDAERRFNAEQIHNHVFFNLLDWSQVWNTPAPELKSGIHTKSATAAAAVVGVEDQIIPLGTSSDTNLTSASDNDGKSGISSMRESVTSVLSPSANRNPTLDESDLQDADDDDSSFSDSKDGSVPPRRRGFSAGASATEKLSSEGNSMLMFSSKRAGNFFRMAAGLALAPDGKGEKSTPSSDSSTPSRALSTLRTISRTGSTLNLYNQSDNSSGAQIQLQNSPIANRSSLPVPITSVTSSDFKGITRRGSTSTSSRQFYASLATSWAALLLPNESLLYSCPILHRNTGTLLRSGIKKRQLLLTDFPRLLCVKETNDQLRVKSEVILGLPKVTNALRPWNRKEDDEDEEDDEDDEEYDDDNENDGEKRNDSRDENRQEVEGNHAISVERIKTRRSSYTSSRMQRQSSAGPLLASSSNRPASTQFTGATSSESKVAAVSTLKKKAMERRESFPLALKQNNSSSGTHLSSLPAASGNSLNQRFSAIQMDHNGHNPFADASPNFMTSIEQKNIRTFMVVTPAKSFLYEDPSGDATHWVKSITTAAASRSIGVGMTLREIRK